MVENEKIDVKKIKNFYALSKLLFDKYVIDNKKKIKSAIGLRYFNVYGPNEYHKKNMSSPILAFYNQIKKKMFVKFLVITMVLKKVSILEILFISMM